MVYQPEGTVVYQPVEDCGASTCGGLWSIDLGGLWSINLWVTVCSIDLWGNVIYQSVEDCGLSTCGGLWYIDLWGTLVY